MKELCTEIEIQASPERVWGILTDLDRYPDWNPFIHRALGKPKVGEQVDIAVRSGSKEMSLHCQVITVEANQELTWKYHVIAPVLFSGVHTFRIEPTDTNRVRFIDREVFNGWLVPLQARDIDTNSKKGFEDMDMALKARAEKVP